MAEREGPIFPPGSSEAERSRWLNVWMGSKLLEHARADTIEALAGATEIHRHDAGAILLRAEDPPRQAHFLIEGVLRVYQARQGTEYTAKLLAAPNHFGELAVLAGLPAARSSIAALTPAVIASLPADVFERAIASDPGLCRAWLYSLAHQFAITIDYLKQTVFGGVPARIIGVLLAHAEAFPSPAQDGWTAIQRPLSYAEIAAHAACTRRGAIKIMNALGEEGLVRSTAAGWQIRARELGDELLTDRLSLHYGLDDNKDPPEAP